MSMGLHQVVSRSPFQPQAFDGFVVEYRGKLLGNKIILLCSVGYKHKGPMGVGITCLFHLLSLVISALVFC